MPAPLDFPVFDADNHLYEAEDALTRHLPAQHKDLFRYVEVKGRKKLVVRNVLTEFIPNPTFEVIARPGCPHGVLRGRQPGGEVAARAHGRSDALHPGVPRAAGPPRAPRRAGRARLRDVPDARQPRRGAAARRPRTSPRSPSTRSTSGCTRTGRYDYEGRIFTTPIVSPCTLEEGIAELELVLERGAKAILVRPAPVANLRGPRSPFLAEFDPFWARVQEAGVPVMLHASDSGYQDYLNTWEGTSGEYVAFRPKTFAYVADGGRTIQDTLASAICHGMLERFPERAARERGERRQLGRPAGQAPRAGVEEDAERVPHAPGRGAAAQRLDQPVLGGVARRPDRADGRRPRLLRLRLPPPGGARRPALVRRAARRATSPAEVETDHVDATCSSCSARASRDGRSRAG